MQPPWVGDRNDVRYEERVGETHMEKGQAGQADIPGQNSIQYSPFERLLPKREGA